MGKMRDTWKEVSEAAEQDKQYGPGRIATTSELRKRNNAYRELRGFRALDSWFNKLDKGTSAICDAISLNTEATLMLIDRIDAMNDSKEKEQQ